MRKNDQKVKELPFNEIMEIIESEWVFCGGCGAGSHSLCRKYCGNYSGSPFGSGWGSEDNLG